jgi:hypothetical protein
MTKKSFSRLSATQLVCLEKALFEISISLKRAKMRKHIFAFVLFLERGEISR